jgi:hypothetical protein
MNTWQVTRQIKHLIEQQVWDGGAKPVFGSVHVSVAPNERYFDKLRFPLAIIRPGSANVDPSHGEEFELIEQQIGVTVIVANANDAIGEATLIGANRSGGSTESKGRGLLEIEEELFDAVARLSAEDGVRIVNRGRSAVAVTIDADIGYIAAREYTFISTVTSNRSYHPASRFRFTDLGGGSASLTWTLPPDRYDRYRVVLRRASGSTPPSTPTSGTDVVLGGPLDTSVTDAPGAGTYSYSLFVWYDEYSKTPSVDQRSSPAKSLAGVVIT